MFLQLSACTLNLVDGSIAGERSGKLTPRELLLIRYLADRAGLDVTRDELLHTAFGYREGTVSRAVDKTMFSLRQKVEVDSRSPEFLLTVDGGYCFRPAASSSPVPGEFDAFIGRKSELDVLVATLSEPGLCSLVGPGGVGKTRLAFRAAAMDSREVVVCELAAATGREGLIRAVASSVGAKLDSTDQIAGALASRGRVLVLLDNFEHLVDCAQVVHDWRIAAPNITFLVTSRQALELVGERVVRLETLGLDSAAELLRVRASERGHPIADEVDVRELAQRLDALPLALELAAVRMSVFTPADLLARIDQRLTLLRSNAHHVPDRHATLGAAVDWSWELLDGEQQTALAELSVFAGEFRLEAAEAVLSTADRGRDAIAVFGELIDRSLVQRRSQTARNDSLRFRLLEGVRDYAAARLDALHPQSRIDAELRHGAFFAKIATSERAVDQVLAIRDIDDMEAAYRRARDRGDMETALDLGQMLIDCFTRLGSTHALAAMIRELLRFDGLDSGRTANLHRGAARAAFDLGDEAEGLRHAHACILAARDAQRPDLEADGVHWLGLVARYKDRWDEALEHYREVSRLARLAGDAFMEASNLLNMLDVHRLQGQSIQAADCAREAAKLYENSDNPWGAARALLGLTVILTDQLALDDADEALDKCASLTADAPDRKMEIVISIRRAQLANARADYDLAIRHYDDATALCEEMGVTDWERMSLLRGVARIHIYRGDYVAARVAAAVALKLAQTVQSERSVAQLEGKLVAIDALEGKGDLEALERVIEAHRRHDDHRSVLQLLCFQAEVQARSDRSAAEATLREAEALVSRQDLPPLARVGITRTRGAIQAQFI